METEAAIPHL